MTRKEQITQAIEKATDNPYFRRVLWGAVGAIPEPTLEDRMKFNEYMDKKLSTKERKATDMQLNGEHASPMSLYVGFLANHFDDAELQYQALCDAIHAYEQRMDEGLVVEKDEDTHGRN